MGYSSVMTGVREMAGSAGSETLPASVRGEQGVFSPARCCVASFSRENGAAEQFRDQGDYGVSEGENCVHVVGNPINQLSQFGLTVPRLPERIPMTTPATRGRLNCVAEVVLEKPLWQSPAFGVGHNPESVSLVGSANGASWYAVPLRIIPERGQVSENSAHSSIKQRCDVLHDDVAGSKLANKTGVFGPETTAVAFNPDTLAGIRNVLAGESADDGVNQNSTSSKLGSGEFAHIVIAGHSRPMLRQNTLAEWIDLAERDGLEPARPLQSQVEATDAGEQRQDFELSPRHGSPVPIGVIAARILASVMEVRNEGSGRGHAATCSSVGRKPWGTSLPWIIASWAKASLKWAGTPRTRHA
jgi:hypothetical protein